MQRSRFADVGQVWIPWDPDRAFNDDRLARAVSEFKPVPNAAGAAAARWLREDALAYHGFAVTYLAMVDLSVHGFYAMCAGQIEISATQREQLGLETRHLSVAKLVWLAKRDDGALSGSELLAHAERRAELVASVQDLAGIAIEPFDAPTEDLFRAPPFGFLPSRGLSLRASGPRLWRPLCRPGPEDPDPAAETVAEHPLDG